MYSEPIPLPLFLKAAFEYPDIKNITDSWRVETAQLIAIITSHMNEMGIYEVAPDLEVYLRGITLHFLVNSPEIIKLVHEAERRERILARTKKSMSD